MEFNSHIAPPYTPDDKESARAKIAADVAAFEAKGGAIEKLDNGQRGRPVLESMRQLDAASMRQAKILRGEKL